MVTVMRMAMDMDIKNLNLGLDSQRNMNISDITFLVTGGAGFIGSHLCDFLVNNQARNVVVLDDLSTGFKKNIEHLMTKPNFQFIEGSITDLNTCTMACKNIDVILHHAALGSVPRSIETVSYTHLRAHETRHDLVCRLLLEKKNFFNDTATTEIYTLHIVGSVRCV